MKLQDTYNIHKKINCLLPFFKSKYLCRKNIHCFLLTPETRIIPHRYTDTTGKYQTTYYEQIHLTKLKCICCGREEVLDE